MGLEKHDLDKLIMPVFGVDLYKPKTGTEEDIVVVSFTIDNELGAKDLASFIDKSIIKDIVDAEPSPGPDPEGQYAVFVELVRNDKTPLTIMKLLNDIKHVVNIKEWSFRSWPTKRIEKLTPTALLDAMNPKVKESIKFMTDVINEDALKVFDQGLYGYTVIDIGGVQKLLEQYDIEQTPISFETDKIFKIQSIFGPNYDVQKLNDYVIVTSGKDSDARAILLKS